MADERNKDDVEELDIAPALREEDQNRDRGRPTNEMPREDADRDAQIRQSGDGNLHLGTQRDPSAETTEARRSSTFDNQDTLDAVSRDAERGNGVAEGEAGENVNFDADVAGDDGRGGEGDDGNSRGGDGPRSTRGADADGASEAARAGASGQAAAGNQGGANQTSSAGLNPLGKGGRSQSAQQSEEGLLLTQPPM